MPNHIVHLAARLRPVSARSRVSRQAAGPRGAAPRGRGFALQLCPGPSRKTKSELQRSARPWAPGPQVLVGSEARLAQEALPASLASVGFRGATAEARFVAPVLLLEELLDLPGELLVGPDMSQVGRMDTERNDRTPRPSWGRLSVQIFGIRGSRPNAWTSCRAQQSDGRTPHSTDQHSKLVRTSSKGLRCFSTK